ncbi:MAG: translation initiation factor IF-2, partial [Lachnospiraceae bacterium]|nr:translation initiation factor IF-2 [Lachnospiraceae bacterium]
MAKMRVNDLSKELGITNKEVISILSENGIEGKTHSSNIEDDAIAIVRAAVGSKGNTGGASEKPVEKNTKKSPASEAGAKMAAKTEKKLQTVNNGNSDKQQKPRDEVSAKKPAVPKVQKPGSGSASAGDGDKKDGPKKKATHVVINRQFSSHGGNGGAGAARRPQRPSRGNEASERRVPIQPRTPQQAGSHTIIRPRVDGDRRIRPSDRHSVPVEETAAVTATPAPEDTNITNEAVNTAPKAPSQEAANNDKKSGAATHISIRRNIYEGTGRPAAGPAPTRNNQGGGNNNRPAQNRSGGQNAPSRPGHNKPAAAEQNAPAQEGKGNGRGNGRRDDKKRRDKDRDQIGKREEQFKNLEKADKKKKPKAPTKPVRDENEILTLTLPERLTIKELADKMMVVPSDIVKKLFMKGTMVTVNQSIDYEQAEEIALEFNCVCEPEEKVDVIAELLKEDEENEQDLIARPPVVCVMGHVDHGKTSLLDAIRDTRVTDREAGGITQKIGAYVVSINGQKITFLDTPGHEAFTAMRMRGANSTDIAILVVAADDGVMPQTVEAINHAKAAGVEIIVAINKIDKPNANIDRVKQELSEYELVPEDWGGSTIFVPVSAHTHEGIDNLLEMILLTAEVMELKANPKRNARGLVLEAELDKGRGVVATVLVQKGTLNVGDPVAAGSSYGKVRAMIDENGRRLKKAGPSTPVEILGLSDVPNAGEIFMSMDNEKEARSFAETFISVGKDKLIEDSRMKMSLDDLFSQIQAGNLKELNIIVKAD